MNLLSSLFQWNFLEEACNLKNLENKGYQQKLIMIYKLKF